MSCWRPFGRHFRSRRVVVTAFAGVALLLAAGCSSSGSSGSAGGSGDGSSGGTTVTVFYAGSLVDLMEKQISPAFKSATGYSFSGFSGGSTDLAAEIKGRVHQGDVFVSASPTADSELQGKKNGDWVSWYATFATSPVVIGYNPQSKFAHDLKTQPWYQVVTEPGFRLGRTDAKTDPKGELAVQALTDTAKKQHEPALAAMAKSTAGVYPEETLVGRLKAGQLDAGFFYTAEATAANIPTVPLTGDHVAATYTATVLNRAPNRAGGVAFVRYLVGPNGKEVLKRDGFRLTPVTVTGSGTPAALDGVLRK